MIGDFLMVFVNILADIVIFAIFARVLLSWFPGGGGGQIKSILYDVTDPILTPFKKIVPRIGMIDISPIVAFISIDIARSIIVALIHNLFM